MAIYTGDAVRMAYLATYGGSHVNGVAELHSQLLKDVTLKNFSDVYPDKFTNVTNGVTPRRFVKLANPRLSDLITEGLGTDKWLSDLEMLKGLEPLAKDDEFVKKFAAVKKANKVDFAAYAKLACFLIGDHALIGGEDCSTKTAKNLRQVLLVSVYTQTRFGNSLDASDDSFVFVSAVF